MQVDERLDDHFKHIWNEYESYLASRAVLDLRTRRLAAIGQCSAMGELAELERLLRATQRDTSASYEEAREAILQACVYIGRPRIERALETFFATADDLAWKPSGATAEPPRQSEEEAKAAWRVSAAQFPKRDALVSRYGWQGMSVGLTTQPNNFPSAISRFDALDEDFARAWLKFVHEGMYARAILDPKTRTMVMIADCIGLNELGQAVLHMLNAIDLGATREQVYELCFQSTQYAGMPSALTCSRLFTELLAKRSAEKS